MLHTHACMTCYGSHPRVLVYYPRHTRETYTHICSIKPTFSWTQFPLFRKPCHIYVIIISKAKARSLNLAGGITTSLHELIGAEVLWICRHGMKWGEVLPRA